MLPKAHLTLHSRMSGSRLVITSWLSGSLRSVLYSSSVYSCHLFLEKNYQPRILHPLQISFKKGVEVNTLYTYRNSSPAVLYQQRMWKDILLAEEKHPRMETCVYTKEEQSKKQLPQQIYWFLSLFRWLWKVIRRALNRMKMKTMHQNMCNSLNTGLRRKPNI